MAVTNNAMLIRRELLTRISKQLNEGTIESEIDRIPIEMRPRYSETSRCCIHKDRAVIKYRIMALLGYNVEDEEDEITPLSEYARKAFDREKVTDTMLTVVDEACSSCVKANYVVTNMCRGCVARPCVMNCNKKAIDFHNGQASIEPHKCVNCGICQRVCPFHAIIYQPVPCEESCPVGAISKDEHGIEHINKAKCINCGKCIGACPFGAIMEKTHFVEIYKAFKSDKKVIALAAPAIAGQFKVSMEKIVGALKELGFDDVIEVALGADVTTTNEAAELVERLEEGAPFMTTSCCPSYVNLVEKHIPELKPYVSHTKTPMYYTAEIARQQYPEGVLVMIAPCTGKRHEAYNDPNVDLVVSFEEFGAMMVAHGVEIANANEEAISSTITNVARGFGYSGGVTNAVKAYAPHAQIEPVVINGIDKSQIKLLKSFPQSCSGNFVEVMSCEGGCVAGCNVIANPKIALRQIDELMKRSRIK